MPGTGRGCWPRRWASGARVSRPEIIPLTSACVPSAWCWGTQRRPPGLAIGWELSGGRRAWHWDPWAWRRAGIIEAYTTLVMGASGAGKSSLIKTYLWRQVQAHGAQLVVTDPKGEYANLAAAAGLRAVHIGPGAGGINPMSGVGPEVIDTAVALAEHRLGRALAGEEEDALARVIETRPPSLAALVLACEDPPAAAVARIPKDVLTSRLSPVYYALRSYLGGRWAGLFDRQAPNPTLGEHDAGIVVDLGITALQGAAVPAMVVVASWLRQLLAHKSPRRRIVVLDEGWALVGHPLVLRALLGLAKLGRSAGVQLILAVHRPSDLLSAVGADANSRDTVAGLISEANTKILYRQDPGELAAATRLCQLSATETRELARLPAHWALWRAGSLRAVVQHQLLASEVGMVDTSDEVRLD